MAFHNVRLPEDVERGAMGGPRFKTRVADKDNGHEKRNIVWERTRGQWDVGYGIQREIDLVRVINFFYARWGRGHSFRFKDWSDYKLDHSIIGIGDGVQTQFQASKRYSSGGYNYDRIITKLVDPITVYVNDIETAATVDLNTGLITFAAPPGPDYISISGEFDCHVRFASDELNVSAESFESGAIPQISIIELK